MNMPNDWCADKLQNLQNIETCLPTLLDIRGQLNDSQNQTDSISQCLLSSDELFGCLNIDSDTSDNEVQLAITTDIISLCLKLVHIDTSNAETAQLLRRTLTSRRPGIRALGLNSLLNELHRQTTMCEVQSLPSCTLLFYVLDELKKQDTEGCELAISILSILLPQKLKEAEVREELLIMLRDNEIVRCRLYVLAVKIAKVNSTSLAAVEFILNAALAELDNDDVLLQSTVLEILTALAEHNHGMLFMERRRLFHIISERVRNLEQNPLDNLLIPSIMKFFGKVATMQPEKIISGYPHMLECLFDALNSDDYSLLPPAVDTLANLSDTDRGKLLLDEYYAKRMKEALQMYAQHLKNLPADLKVRLFNTLQVIFTVENTISTDISKLLRKWIKYITGGDQLQICLDYSRNPFADIKIASLSLVKTICTYNWGVEMFKNTAGFLEYLLDRKLEVDKSVKLVKWEIITILSNSSSFDVQTSLQLSKYVKDGPYLANSDMNVATEGE